MKSICGRSCRRFTDFCPLYMTTDNFCGKLGTLCKKNPSTLQRAFLPLLGGTGKKFLCTEPLPLSNGQIEAICLTIVTENCKKRSACLHDRRFREAAAIRLCPCNLRRFPAITGRCRPPRPAAAGAKRTPDTARSAAARPPRDSSARRPPSCGWTVPRKTAF